jgi:hypothetical protein
MQRAGAAQVHHGPLGSFAVRERTILIPLQSEAERADALVGKLLTHEPVPVDGFRRVAAAIDIADAELSAALKRAGAVLYRVPSFGRQITMARAAGSTAGAR